MRRDNAEAYEKLYSSTGSSAQFPSYPKHLEEMAEEEIGSWTMKDPSTWPLQSFLVAKFQGLKGDMDKEMGIFKVLDKILPTVVMVAIAFFAKLAIDSPEKVAAVVDIAKLITEFGMLIVLVKLLKVATMVQFLLWKTFGSFSKLEFAMICAGG